MRLTPALGIAIISLAACAKTADRETGTLERHSVDTVVTQREMRDTGIITHDTAVSSDTIYKRGARAAKTDTVKKP